MERKNIVAIAGILALAILIIKIEAMGNQYYLRDTDQIEAKRNETIQALQKSKQEEEERKTLQEQEEAYFQNALRLSEESAKKEDAAILKPGLYQQYVDIQETPNVDAKPFKVYQIAVKNPQSNENVSCGPRALFIAHAIDALHAAKRPISTKTIDKILSQNDDYTQAVQKCAMQLESNELPTFIETNNLKIKQYFVMGRITSKEGMYPIIPYVPAYDPEKPLQFDISLKILGQELDANRVHHPIHFIFSDTSKTHWVLISVIKSKRSDPVVYYVDPKNVNIKSYPVADNYIQYVVNKLDLPFPKSK